MDTSQGTTFLGDDNAQDNGTTDDNGTPNYLEQLVGDGKKYKTVDELAKAYANADQFIEQIKTEKRELETKYTEAVTQARTVEELMEALNNPNNGTPATPATPAAGGGLDKDSLFKEFQSMLAQQEQAKQSQEIIQKSWNKLDEVFGSRESAKEAVKTYVGNDPSRRAAIDALGASDPDSLVRLLKDIKPKGEVFTEDGTNSEFNPSESSTGLTWAHARKVRKENPKLYNSVAFQSQLHKAANANPNFFKE